MTTSEIRQIADFWLVASQDAPETAFARRDWWYEGAPEIDDEIRARFGLLVEQACNRELMHWTASAEGSFALVLLLDQFTRNIYRNTPRAYAGDACSFEVVCDAIAGGQDGEMHPVSRIWLYHPFHHSEELAEQDRGLALLQTLRNEAEPAWHAYVERSIRGWTRHRDIVARFGRFPHRNAVLGRVSTDEEQRFIEGGAESFGQGPADTGAQPTR